MYYKNEYYGIITHVKNYSIKGKKEKVKKLPEIKGIFN